MTVDTLLIDPLQALVEGRPGGVVRVGLAVPTSGPLALTAPSALACAVLAAEEVNAAGGIAGRRLELVPVDAGRAPGAVATDLRHLVDAGLLDAVCGYHTSDVHRRLEQVTAGRLPYVFTPPHEGGRRSPGVVLLGEGPAEQLQPLVHRFATRPALRRWALVGNDYIWPWAVHAAAAGLLRTAGAQVAFEERVPFGRVEPDRLLDRLRRERVQVVLLSLVGRDLATFNRAFRDAGLARSIVRVSGALEETGLLETGGDDSGELYAAMRWFASDQSGAGFPDRYADRWGATAPPLGVYAQGCYEGVHVLAGLGGGGGSAGRGAVGSVVRQGGPAGAPVKVARADGLSLTVVG